MQIGHLSQILNGARRGDDVAFSSVSIDTRSIQPGQLFIALIGPRFDGHDYIDLAQQQGATAALVSKFCDSSLPQIKVDNTHRALIEYATWHARQFHPKVIALTGSCGKTSTRALLESIFAQQFNVLATQGNFNNEIGVPLMLLRLTAEHEVMILELGANHVGEIARLADMVQPDIGIITNVAPAHIEGFGSLANVARAKGELFDALGEHAIAIMNSDDEFYDYWLDRVRAKKINFGQTQAADVQGTIQEESDRLEFLLRLPDEECSVSMQLLGDHNMMNALAAAAAAYAAGLSGSVIQAGLQAASPVSQRSQVKSAQCGARVIDDSYNANPRSVKAAISLLAKQKASTVLVLADMVELGDQAKQWHYEMGEFAREQGIGSLFLYGDLVKHCLSGYGEHARHFPDHQTLIAALKKELTAQTVVLVKGSNSMQMHRVVQALIED